MRNVISNLIVSMIQFNLWLQLRADQLQMDKFIAGNHGQEATTDHPLSNHPINRSPEKLRLNKNSKIKKKSPQPPSHEPEIEDDLLKEIQKTETVLAKFQKVLSQRQPEHIRNSLEGMKKIEEMIQYKDHVIKQIEDEIKSLKAGRYNFMEDINDQGTHIYRLSYEIKMQREELLKLQSKHSERRKEIQRKKQQMKQTEKKYIQKCQNEGAKFISFEEFKSALRQRNREDLFGKTKKKPKIYRDGLKEDVPIIETKKIKEFTIKKNVTETALKTAKKKHQIQINDLMGKLQFLRDENSDLDERVSVKEQELKTAENKFSESRNPPGKRFTSARRLRTENY